MNAQSITLTGVINDVATLSGTIQEAAAYEPKGKLYDGKYSVIPDTDAVVLPTKDKTMREDIKVFAIPYWETSNDTGTTVTIGGNYVI